MGSCASVQVGAGSMEVARARLAEELDANGDRLAEELGADGDRLAEELGRR